MLGLTKQQHAVLTFIKQHISDKGFSPSYEDIGQAMNLSSVSTIAKHVKALKERGYIDYAYGVPRSITILQQS